MNLSIIKYRPEFDGLRAIAVISVIFYHFLPEFFKFGYLGVDIFFVISGYLITYIIFQEFKKKNFSFTNFYCKRIRRLFPALITTIFIVYIFSIFILLPEELEELGKHIFSSTFFFQNFNLFNEIGYFDSEAIAKPLLHFWSLSVEEQFYLIWPIFFVYILINYRSHFLKILIILILLSLISRLGLSIVSNEQIKIDNFNFYMISGRMYEFLAGAILVNFKLNSKFHKLEKNLHFYNFFFSLSLFFFILCLFISTPTFFLKFENNFLNIDFRAFVLIIFLMNLIFFSSRSSLAKKLLGNKIIVYIGKISYPLYLIHWPIFSMLNIIFIKPTISSLVFGFLFSIVLSALIYHMIETPLKRVKNLKKLAIYLCCIMFLISLVGITTVINKGFPNRIDTQLKLIVKGMSDWKPLEGSIQKTISGITVNSNNSENDDEILVIGDSLAVQYWPMVHKLTQEGLATKISFLTRQGCSPVKNFYSLTANCSNYHEEIFELLQSSPKIKKIIISSSYNYNFNGANMHMLFSDLVENLLNFANVTVILPAPADRSKFNPKRLFYINGIRYLPIQNFNIIGEQTFDLKNLAYYDHWMEPILIKKGLDYIKTSDLVCPNAICKILDSEGYPIFFDGGHFTARFVRTGLPSIEKLFIK